MATWPAPGTDPSSYAFDGFLRHDELGRWLEWLAHEHGDLVELSVYGRSSEGRELWLLTITDPDTGPHDTKPAHWVDASIHSVELTATVAACHLAHRLVSAARSGDEPVVRALRTRTFYVAPRVNPDGAEAALADRPRFRRSSLRPWPWPPGREWPGLVPDDVDGDGRILQMRLVDPDGAWMPHSDDERVMVPVPPEGPPPGAIRYRVLTEGSVRDHDGFTIPTPRPAEGLDLNRNFPAEWGTGVTGSGDHPTSEPEIDALVRAVVARPNVCGYNAFHTSGGVLLRPSSVRADADLPPLDVWTWKELAARGTELTGYPCHSVYEDFTWDRSKTMSGASDDWAYEHLGVYSWTTEFWDVVEAATGEKQSSHFWYTGPDAAQSLAVLRWCDEHRPDGHVDWYPFDHPDLGAVELGGWDDLRVWINPPPDRLRAEVAPHADFAVHQALCAPCLEIKQVEVTRVADEVWRLEVGVANTGWLPTHVTERARANDLVRPVVVELVGDDVVSLDGPAARRVGQLEGRAAMRFRHGNDGTPDRVLVRWLVRAAPGSTVEVVAAHQRAGTARASVDLVD